MSMPRALRRRVGAGALAVAVTAGLAVGTAAPAAAAPDTTYIALYKGNTDAAQAVAAAGGTLVADWPQIGVVVARSSRAGFEAALEGTRGVEGAAATTGLGVKAPELAADGPVAGDVPANGAGEPLAARQWDMRQIKVPEAQAITGGNPSVVVATLDTGMEFTHPDLAPNYSAADSADCSSGTPQPLVTGNDKNGHGTHTAGTMAAAVNGIGIAGVAPNVKLAGVRTANDDSYFFPEMVVCSFMWVAQRGIEVTNNSYFADPWLYNCKNDPEQRTIWNAERRAIQYAQSKGTVVVASEGNQQSDLSHPESDFVSPDFPAGSEQVRQIRNSCAVVPVEVPGVIGVSATGVKRFKSYYSDYGISTVDVAAPGGDAILQLTPEAPNGRVLSTWPSYRPCARPVVDQGATYCYAQGTSMAGPHVAGVAALYISHTGKTGRSVEAALQRATNPIACPSDMSIYAPFPQMSGAPQSCQGGTAHNSFYGSGEIDALKAVS